MIEKIVNFILFLIFCCLNYFFYLKIYEYEVAGIIGNKLRLFFILLIFFNIILLTFIFFKMKNKKTVLLKRIDDYEEKISKLHFGLEQAKQKSIKELLSNIAHHWRQPLTIISLLSTLMQMYKKENIELSEIIKNGQIINDNAQYLSKIIEEFSKKHIVNEKKEMLKIDLILEDFLLTYDFSGINISFDLKENLYLYTYKKEFIKILDYILINAKEKFIERDIKNKMILIELFENKNFLIIQIKDNAGGIKKEIINRIFEPYVTTKFKSKNVGLGLYLTYKIITQELNGKIEAKNIEFYDEISQKKYKGSQFILQIPRI